MRIHHAAVYTNDLERLRDFYVRYFNGVANAKYHNPVRGFSSYFLSFGGEAELELMALDARLDEPPRAQPCAGYAHIAFSAGGRQDVDALTGRLRSDGFKVVGGPRTTGDGHYESAVLDPDGNLVEIAAEG